ncbi:uncharacterized protein LAESUDRAFT_660664, partial [Laetiporus sulphureus 93-53]
KIRMHASQMLGRDFVDSPLPVASLEDLQAFDRKKHDGPSKGNFRLQMTGSLKSRWNKQAAGVFAENFMSIGVSDCQDKSKIECMFATHLATLRSQYRRQLRGGEEPSEVDIDREIEEKREHRRRAVSIALQITSTCILMIFGQLRERRSNAVGAHSHLARFQDLWDRIPHTAMSGDESDHSRGKVRYVVTRMSWRSAEFETWLKVFDWMHLSSRFTVDGKPKRGAFPRYRRRGSRRCDQFGKPVSGLPRNCYDAIWLAGLDEEERLSLEIQPAIDLTHSETVMACVISRISIF